MDDYENLERFFENPDPELSFIAPHKNEHKKKQVPAKPVLERNEAPIKKQVKFVEPLEPQDMMPSFVETQTLQPQAIDSTVLGLQIGTILSAVLCAVCAAVWARYAQTPKHSNVWPSLTAFFLLAVIIIGFFLIQQKGGGVKVPENQVASEKSVAQPRMKRTVSEYQAPRNPKQLQQQIVKQDLAPLKDDIPSVTISSPPEDHRYLGEFGMSKTDIKDYLRNLRPPVRQQVARPVHLRDPVQGKEFQEDFMYMEKVKGIASEPSTRAGVRKIPRSHMDRRNTMMEPFNPSMLNQVSNKKALMPTESDYGSIELIHKINGVPDYDEELIAELLKSETISSAEQAKKYEEERKALDKQFFMNIPTEKPPKAISESEYVKSKRGRPSDDKFLQSIKLPSMKSQQVQKIEEQKQLEESIPVKVVENEPPIQADIVSNEFEQSFAEPPPKSMNQEMLQADQEHGSKFNSAFQSTEISDADAQKLIDQELMDNHNAR